MEFFVKGVFDFLFAFFVSLAFLPLVYNMVKKLKAKQTILEYVDMHKNKAGTPTMGGIAFILGFMISAVSLLTGYVKPLLVCVVVMLLNALVGFYDDYKKIKQKKNEGLKPWQKLLFQTLIFFAFSYYLYKKGFSQVVLPFAKLQINLGFWIVPLGVILGIFFTNSTNLADGLDGLECFIAVPSICLLGVFLSLIPASANFNFLKNAEIFINSGLILIIFSGALFSFIFYNSYPAKIFMGDTGSLAVGAIMVAVTMVSGTVLYLFLFGILFVLTSVSVIIQVAYYKLTKRRIFLMAPLHHHFEKKGVHESKIAVSYFIISTIVSLVVIFVELM